jgi:hypothetical protein
MITKNQTKTQFYLDRDTNVEKLVDEMLRVKRAEAIVFLRRQHERLQEKDAGTFFTLEDTLKLKDGELENMQRFFRGAVVPYYVRQKYNIWSPAIDGEMLTQGTDEIKRAVGFMKYDHTGHITDDVNSMTTFERAKDLNEWLKAVEEVCFDDESFIFPDSKHFLQLVKDKGRHAAQRQVVQELHEKVKNRYQGRNIIN